MIECDIETPEELRGVFGEMQAIVKHAWVDRESIGPVMKSYCERTGLLKKPTNTLLASYYGKKILLASPLLRWYLNHGLRVTKVYQIIQYKPVACFKSFGDAVMEARREGDRDPRKKVLSDSAKLMGK